MAINSNDAVSVMVQDVLAVITNLTEDSQPLFKHVTLFNNQIERFGGANNFDINNQPINTNAPFDWPACFVEVIVDSVNDLSGSYQEVNGRLICHISMYDYDLYEELLKPFAFAFKVHQSLHLLKHINDRYSLRRMSQITDRNYSNLYTSQLIYQFKCTDNTHESEYGIFGTNGISFFL
jgi:hypothetical protein